jgi:hypothetical protein
LIVGIVGSEEAKFTPLGKKRAMQLIEDLLEQPGVEQVVSGGCHLGGIDIWAREIGMKLELNVTEYIPKERSWEKGYKPRNLLIAQRSDIVHCITIREYPKEYTGMRFAYCYHCLTDTHIKSGGCWTMREAVRLGKKGEVHVIENY